MSDDVELHGFDGEPAPPEVLAAVSRVVARPRLRVAPSTEQVHTFFGRMAEAIKQAGGHPR